MYINRYLQISDFRKGFSLLEFLIYISIIAIVGLLVGGAFVGINQGRGTSTARTEVDSAIRFALAQIRQDIMTSTVITTPHPGKIMTCSATQACLTAVGTSTINYYVTAGGQVQRVSSTTDNITPPTVNVTSLTVEYFGNANVPTATPVPTYQVLITAKSNNSNPNSQYSETRQATFAPVQVYATAIRGAISSGPAGTAGTCIPIPLVGDLCQ